MIEKDQGLLIRYSATPDKPFSNRIDLVYSPWCGKKPRVVKGIRSVIPFPTGGTTIIPGDSRAYDLRHDTRTRSDHFQEMLDKRKNVDYSRIAFFSMRSIRRRKMKMPPKDEPAFSRRLRLNR